MATVTPRSASREGVESLTVREWVAGDEEASHSDRYLAARLAAATADYKGVALTTFLLGAGVGVLAWLGIGILAEHWVVAGGLPRWLRWSWLALGLVALAAAAVRWLVPLVRYRVNLVYAARQIEREHPELHNDLVNTVLVKARPDGSPSVVVTSLKRRTARRLADVAGSTTMDRTTAVRLAYALMAAVGLACLYEVVAPKSLLVSAARLVAPWIGWAAPSRVRIDGPRLAWRLPDEPDAAAAADVRRRVTIDGGRAVVVRGRQLEVTAGIRGLRAGEQPVCLVTPLTDAGGIDPQATSWQVVMHSGPDADPGGRLFTALLPDATRGLDRSLDVSIVGGDAHTEPVRVAVVDAPSLLVREVRYDFPAYTRRQPETVAWQGDLRAVEETLATLTVEANQPLEAAWVDFGCDGQRDLKIKLSGTGGRQGTVSFPLRLNADRLAAEHPTYRLVFQGAGAAGGRDGVVTDSLVHRIEVVADIAPEVVIEEPSDSPRRVPPGSPVLVRVRASDPDFGLARVGIETRIKGGGQVTPIVLLDEPREGVFKGSTRLVPDKLGAGAGSVLEYRGFAIDTRPQQTNVVHSPWQELQIDAAAKPQAQPADQPGIPDDPQRGDDRRGDGARDGAGGGRDAAGPRDRKPRDGAAGERGADEGDTRDGREPGERQKESGENAGDTGAGEENPRAGGRDRQPEAGRGQQRERDPSREPRDQPADQPGEGGGGGEGQQAGDRGAGEAGGQQPNQGQNQQGGRGGRQGQPRDGASGGPSAQSGDQSGDDGMPAEGSADGGGGDRQRQPAGGAGGGRQADSERKGERKGSADGQPAGEGAGGEGDPRDDGRPAGGGRDRNGSGRDQTRVAADGTNDGEAMERILEDRRRQGGDDAVDGSRAGAAESGRQGEDRQGTDQRRADRSGQSSAGERTPRNGDSAPGGQDASAAGESGEATPPDGDPAATDAEKAGGTSGRKTRPNGASPNGDSPNGEKGNGTGEAGQPTDGGDGERPARAEADQRSDDRAGNDPRNGDGQPAAGDREPGDQRDARTSGGKENGSGRKGDDPRQTDGQSPDDGDGTPGRDPKRAGGREDAQQRGDDQTAGQKGVGEKGGQQGGGQKEATEDGAGEKGAGEKGAGEKGAGEKGAGEKGAGQQGESEQGAGGKKPDQNRQDGRDQSSGQEGIGQQGGAGQRGGAEADGEKRDGAKAGSRQHGGAKGDGQQGDDANAQGAGGSPEDQGQPDGAQAGGEQGAEEPSDAAADGGKPNGGGKPAGGKPGNASGRQSGKAGQGGGAEDPEGAPPTEGADPGPQQEGNTGKGGWARSDGAADPQQGPVDGATPTAETEWGRQDVDHARNAADLAIAHLRRSLEKGDDTVLESLGWTKDDARTFLERWQTLRQQAEGGDPVKRREFERTLRSLGLRGGNVRSNRDVPSDVKGGQAEGRRSRPPSEYRERFKAYTQGTTSE